ncbi:hypothetical protein EDF81_4295 [Enterobacter sp. BIGb0383]|uniref:hypothetical protein n=1 Tax=unclassified Enterobacter TaxID=2608935 RepID=UPI000F4A4C24|nr:MULTISPECIES: hypothetical protein [unclassified Enterobacter]ROP50069.1 hypothetical protein EDF81_4295 [Enterobacter sp. BIGb0383]ROS06188.1 hypothetical protein EC848_3512 [Enterobacter sp. BIGb0359]
MKHRRRQSDGPTVFQRLTRLWTGKPEHSTRGLLESVLPVASLYGVDTANIDPEWFREQRTR